MPGKQVALLRPSLGNQTSPERVFALKHLMPLDSAERERLEKPGAELQIVRSLDQQQQRLRRHGSAQVKPSLIAQVMQGLPSEALDRMAAAALGKAISDQVPEIIRHACEHRIHRFQTVGRHE